ncbi:uncharacterized protein LOC123869877 isoform X1 [Maniola jurtina]|uniref:uncharacterized protein LOC123869877 isoform X1 n=1 Tax=Maniola jurtina TaxID=191418 RepID=UPI001E68DC0F|nr:uncharacterized protein LOC123869877 isoform X1 [Maniola jurtina]
MECDDDGSEQARAARGRGIKRHCGAGAPGIVRLAFTAAVPGAARARASPAPPAPRPPHQDPPFMSNMDEISYWIYTKRAPCLFNYDNILKKQSEQPQCSTAKPPSVKSEDREPSPKKKKLLDEDSVSTEKQQNVYFKTPQIQKPALNSCKSDRADSDIEFNINSSSGRKKSKNMKLQKTCLTREKSKKNKVCTSTPKVVQLRRSLRTAQQKWNNSNLNSSFEIFNASIVNGKQDVVEEEDKQSNKVATNNQSKSKVMSPRKGTNDIVLNGQFEDLSDVSGFTANYIRSTKVHSSKRPQKLRNQNTRALTKHSKQKVQCDKIMMCVNKSVNTGFPDTAALSCSTDSSENAIKLVTVKSQEQSTRVNKSTSLLKFMETKLEGNNNTSKSNKRESKNNLNISFQSRSSGASRYPRRHRNNTETHEPNCSTNIALSKPIATGRRYNMRKGTLNVNRKENSEEKVVSKTRSGRRRGLKLDVEETNPSVLQLDSSMEQVTSSPGVNVACPNTKSTGKDNTSSRCLRSRTVNRDKVGQFYKESSSEGSNKKLSGGLPCALVQSTPKCVRKVKKSAGRTAQSLSRDSLRDKSGFAACFSDSDSDSAPLKQRKFFC